jgi:outer membrane protein assembly factor BamB
MAVSQKLLVGLIVFSFTSTGLQADTWPGFRGKAGSGVSNETDLPLRWSENENVAWKTDLPGRADSSPAVTQNLLFLTTQEPDASLHVLAVDRANGDVIWNKEVGRGKLATTGPKSLYVERHNAATPSPVADESHVWAFFGTGLLVCLDHDGNKKWEKDLVSTYGGYDITFGMSSSPRLWGDLLYVACMTKAPSYVVALDKRTGEQIWKTDRQYPAVDDGPDAYSTPIVYEGGKRPELLVAGSDHVDAYDLHSGERLWFSSGLRIDSQYGRILASPAVGAGVVVVSSAHPLGSGIGHAIAVKPGGSGDISKSADRQLWKYKTFSPDAPTPVCYQGKVYMVRDGGVGSCLDLKTGKQLWRRRLGKGPFRASTIAGDDKVYFLNRDGMCAVIAANGGGEVLAKNRLPGTFFATPAVADGTLYLRGHHTLYAVEAAASE